jgi:tetratricopeptide (TPR) repeat protein
MRNGKPFISTENIRAALDRLVYSATHSDENALEHLLIIDSIVSHPDFPPSSRGREFALNSLLISIITSQLEHHRHLHDRALEPVGAGEQEVLMEITKDAQTGSPELLGWGWFYYHYVRSDLNISQLAFSQLTHLDERTLRRYQQHTLRQLADAFIEQEHAARSVQRARHLYAELPTHGALTLVGRDESAAAVLNLLQTNSPKHIQITGMAGVGKSALVECVVRELIDTGVVEQVVWLEHPPSTDFVRAALSEKFVTEETAGALRDYLILYPTVIILDDVDVLLEKNEDIAHLLQELSAAIVFLIGRSYALLTNVADYALHEISQNSACQLIEQLLPSIRDEQTVWQVTGGNPLAIKLAVRQMPLTEHFTLGIESFFSTADSRLTEDVRRAWFTFALLPPRPIAIHFLRDLLPDLNPVRELIRYHLVEALEVPPEHCRLTHAARQYLISRYQNDIKVRCAAEEMILSLDRIVDTQVDIPEYLLLCGWLQLSIFDNWKLRFWRVGVSKGHWGTWKTILQDTSQEIAELRLAYGICARCLGEWEHANAIFSDIIRGAGKLGDFTTQAQAMLEQAKTLRYQSHYQQALNLLARLERILIRQKQDVLLQAVHLEQARIAIDGREIETGQRLLSSIPKTLASQVLWAELYLLSGDYERCRQLAYGVLDLVEQELHLQARIHTIIARSYIAQRDLYKAQNHFYAAVSLLEQFHDPFALARAESNLASIYITMDQHHDARILLVDAEHIQRQLNDMVGLAATKHNLRLLKM